MTSIEVLVRWKLDEIDFFLVKVRLSSEEVLRMEDVDLNCDCCCVLRAGF